MIRHELPAPHMVGCTSSTNLVISQQFTAQAITPFESVMARHQSAGRGRSGHSWYAPHDSSLLLSIATVVPEDTEYLGWVPLAVAIATKNLLTEELPGATVQIKWPNDVLLDGRKVCGILAEYLGVRDGHHWVCVGIGLNLLAAPQGATAMSEYGWKGTGPTQELGARLTKLVADCLEPETLKSIPTQYREVCTTLGTEVTATLPTGLTLTGIADTIDDSGALVIDGHAVTAADVTLTGMPAHTDYTTFCEECQ